MFITTSETRRTCLKRPAQHEIKLKYNNVLFNANTDDNVSFQFYLTCACGFISQHVKTLKQLDETICFRVIYSSFILHVRASEIKLFSFSFNSGCASRSIPTCSSYAADKTRQDRLIRLSGVTSQDCRRQKSSKLLCPVSTYGEDC